MKQHFRELEFALNFGWAPDAIINVLFYCILGHVNISFVSTIYLALVYFFFRKILVPKGGQGKMSTAGIN